jgi:DNA-binding IclR family transcriptional regulator
MPTPSLVALAGVPANAKTDRADRADKADPSSSVEKACRILKVFTTGGSHRLTDIAVATGLDKATALRLLEVLSRDGFIQRDMQTKCYASGPELLGLGAAALAQFDPRAVVRPSLMRLAGEFEDTAILSVPSGFESLCVDVELGSFPIRANYLEVGSRRPLGVGAGSLALLAWMPEREREAAMPQIEARLGRHPRINRSLLEAHMDIARQQGYAVLLDVVVDRMGGIAMPLMGPDGRPVGAISIAALSDRISSREAALAQGLKREVAICESLWRNEPVRSKARA